MSSRMSIVSAVGELVAMVQMYLDCRGKVIYSSTSRGSDVYMSESCSEVKQTIAMVSQSMMYEPPFRWMPLTMVQVEQDDE